MKRAYSLLKISFVVSGLILSVVLIAIVGVLVVLSTVPSTKDILGCFTTSMYHVELCPKNNQYVRISTLPSQLQWGVILSEDGAFYSHKGLDWFELRESMEKNIKTHSYSRGGSTITQQLVKNLYLTSDKSLLRKFKEVLLALDVEKKLKKSQILELYFNVVEFGPNLFGIKKASQYYFGKSPSALSVSESVFLSSLLPNPKFFGLSKKTGVVSKGHQNRMKIVAARLEKTGRITEAQYSIVRQRVDNGFWQTSDAEFEPKVEELMPDDATLDLPDSSEEPPSEDL